MTKTGDIDLMRKATVAALEGYEQRMWGNPPHGTAIAAAKANGYSDPIMESAYIRGWNRADTLAGPRPAFYDAAARVLKLSSITGALGHGADHTDTKTVVEVCLRYADAVDDDTDADNENVEALATVVEVLAESENELRDEIGG